MRLLPWLVAGVVVARGDVGGKRDAEPGDTERHQLQRGYLRMREGQPVGVGAVMAWGDAGGECDTERYQLQRGYLSMPEGQPVGAGRF